MMRTGGRPVFIGGSLTGGEKMVGPGDDGIGPTVKPLPRERKEITDQPLNKRNAVGPRIPETGRGQNDEVHRRPRSRFEKGPRIR